MTRRKISLKEIAQHNTRTDCWMAIYGRVFDVTSFVEQHPGGEDLLMEGAGKEATEYFDGIHSDEAKEILKKYEIGVLATEEEVAAEAAAIAAGQQPPASAVEDSDSEDDDFGPKQTYFDFELIARIDQTPNTALFRFAIPKDSGMVLTVGAHVSIRFPDPSKPSGYVSKPYTPVAYTRDHFDLLVKCYPNGEVSPRIFALAVGDKVSGRGPITRYTHEHTVGRDLVLIGAGTGITPLFSVIDELVRNGCKNRMVLLFGNRSERDVLMHDELSRMEAKHDSLDVKHVLSRPDTVPSPVATAVGRITSSVIMSHVPHDLLMRACFGGVRTSPRILICGSTEFNKQVEQALIDEFGVDKSNIFCF